MRRICSLCFVVLYLNYVFSQYDHNIVSEDEEEYQLYYHKSSVLSNADSAYIVNVRDTISECAHHCAVRNDICKSVDVKLENKKYKCFYYKLLGNIRSGKSHEGVISTTPDVIPYCSSLDYLNICGKCKCIDLPSTKKSPYACDCTDYAKTTKDCQDASDNGYTQSGIYTINPDNGKPFKVYCIMDNKRKALTTILRRIDKDSTFLSTNDSYYFKNDDNTEMDHMIGVENIHRLTNFTSMDLLIKLSFKDYFASKFVVKGKEEDYKYDFLELTLSNANSWFGVHKNQGQFKKCGATFWWYCHANPASTVAYAKLSIIGYERYCVLYLHRTEVK